jgi:hypothetical protein
LFLVSINLKTAIDGKLLIWNRRREEIPVVSSFTV